MASAPEKIRDDATLAILAGGEGSRMGMAKGLLTIKGRPILEYLLDEIAWTGPTMLVTAPGREHPPGWRRFDLEAVDPESGGGPLRGVLTALEHLTTPYLLILTVDMPAVRAAQSDRVLACVKSDPKNLGAMMSRLVDGQPRIEPFPCAMRIEARPVIAARLARNRRSIHGLLDEPGFDVLPAPADWNDDVWMNLNFPDDTAKLERR